MGRMWWYLWRDGGGGRAGAARDGEQGEGMNEDTQNKAEQSWSGRACGERVVGA